MCWDIENFYTDWLRYIVFYYYYYYYLLIIYFGMLSFEELNTLKTFFFILNFFNTDKIKTEEKLELEMRCDEMFLKPKAWFWSWKNSVLEIHIGTEILSSWSLWFCCPEMILTSFYLLQAEV